jgi:HTH-type transcriptional regulator / antitoxin HigA
MSRPIVSSEYGALLKKVSPKVIRTEKESQAYVEVLYELDQCGQRLSAAERELAELLTLLIEDFEEKNYQPPRSKPVAVLRFLMEQRELLQKHLVDIFGTQSVVSGVMSGKRGLNKEHIRRLAA